MGPLEDSRIRGPPERAEYPRILGAGRLLQRGGALLYAAGRRSRSHSSAPAGVFRIDHDEKFNQTTHIQYQPWKRGPWMGFNWRYDSGLVAGPVPCSPGRATCADLDDSEWTAGDSDGEHRGESRRRA